jgi:hypothetical protein
MAERVVVPLEPGDVDEADGAPAPALFERQERFQLLVNRAKFISFVFGSRCDLSVRSLTRASKYREMLLTVASFAESSVRTCAILSANPADSAVRLPAWIPARAARGG